MSTKPETQSYEEWSAPAFDNGTEDGSSSSFGNTFDDEKSDSTTTHANDFDHKESLLERLKNKNRDQGPFQTDQFTAEDTLLTNVEEYSRKIREDAEHYSKKIREEIELLKSEVEVELANALLIKKSAEEEKEQIINEAKNSEEKIRQESEKKGHEEGVLKGLKSGEKQAQEQMEKLEKFFKQLVSLRNILLQRHESEIVEFSILLAKKIVRQELSMSKKVILSMLKEVISHFEGQGTVKIRIHPMEYEYIKGQKESMSPYLEEGQRIALKADSNVKPSQPVIETDFSEVDLSLEKQFKIIENELRTCVKERSLLFKKA